MAETLESRYSSLIALIKEFEQYEQEKNNNDLRQFAIWLHNKMAKQDGKENSIAIWGISAADRPKGFVSQFDRNRKFGYLIGRMHRFGRHYFKKAFQGLPISTIEEFSYLTSIIGMGQPSKSELNFTNLTETTSGAEIIKRLLNMELINEVPDTVDKRVKRLIVTSKGEAVQREAAGSMEKVSRLMAGNLPEDVKQQLVEGLLQLDEFHTSIYPSLNESELDELIKKHILQP
jgi:DNA-binding MarR family transcriptional regulator